jgi:hypothetical protein
MRIVVKALAFERVKFRDECLKALLQTTRVVLPDQHDGQEVSARQILFILQILSTITR